MESKPIWLTDKQKELNVLKHHVRLFLKKLSQYNANLAQQRLTQVNNARKRMANNRQS